MSTVQPIHTAQPFPTAILRLYTVPVVGVISLAIASWNHLQFEAGKFKDAGLAMYVEENPASSHDSLTAGF